MSFTYPFSTAQQEHDPVAKSNNEFAEKWFRALAADESSSIMSPFSMLTCLLMVANGTSNRTQKELLEAIHVDNLHDINCKMKELLKEIPVTIANSVWMRPRLDPNPQYQQGLSECFDGVVSSLTSAQQVNQWCSQKTNGKIATSINKLSPTDAIVLVNAICFKGTWQFQFPRHRTRQAEFNAGPFDRHKCQMMSLISGQNGCPPLKYIENKAKNYQAIKLPYKNEPGNARLDAIVILPDNKMASNSFDFQSVLKEMEFATPKDGCLDLPKFTIESDFELKGALQKIGVRSLFKQRRDMRPMLTHVPAEGIGVQRVVHKTVVEVNEEGTDAAAVTAFLATATFVSAAGHRARPFHMVCNKPFYFLICQGHKIIFVGHVKQPKCPNNESMSGQGTASTISNPWFVASPKSSWPTRSSKPPSIVFGPTLTTDRHMFSPSSTTPSTTFQYTPSSTLSTTPFTSSSNNSKSILKPSNEGSTAWTFPTKKQETTGVSPLFPGNESKTSHVGFSTPATLPGPRQSIFSKLPESVVSKHERMGTPPAADKTILTDILNTDALGTLGQASTKFASDTLSPNDVKEIVGLLESAYWIMTFCANEWLQSFGEPFPHAYYNLACVQSLFVELEIRNMISDKTQIDNFAQLPMMKEIDESPLSPEKMLGSDVPPKPTLPLQTTGQYFKARLDLAQKLLRVSHACGYDCFDHAKCDRDLKALRDFDMP